MAKAGFNFQAQVGASIIALARDVNMQLGADEIDVSTRGDAGWKNFIQGLKEWGATFQLLYVSGNAVYETLRTAFLAGTSVVDFRLMDDGGEGWKGTVLVMDFPRAEPLNDGVVIDVTVKGQGAVTLIDTVS